MGVGFGIAPVLFGSVVSRLLGTYRPDAEKLSPYECGFEAFEDARMKFDVRYYLVAILFILFDLEIAFLFPWAVTLNEIGLFGFLSMMVFLAILAKSATGQKLSVYTTLVRGPRRVGEPAQRLRCGWGPTIGLPTCSCSFMTHASSWK